MYTIHIHLKPQERMIVKALLNLLDFSRTTQYCGLSIWDKMKVAKKIEELKANVGGYNE